MEKIKKALRMVGLIILIILACTGLFAGAVMLHRSREKYMNKEITTEQVDKLKQKGGEIRQIKN